MKMTRVQKLTAAILAVFAVVALLGVGIKFSASVVKPTQMADTKVPASANTGTPVLVDTKERDEAFLSGIEKYYVLKKDHEAALAKRDAALDEYKRLQMGRPYRADSSNVMPMFDRRYARPVATTTEPNPARQILPPAAPAPQVQAPAPRHPASSSRDDAERRVPQQMRDSDWYPAQRQGRNLVPPPVDDEDEALERRPTQLAGDPRHRELRHRGRGARGELSQDYYAVLQSYRGHLWKPEGRQARVHMDKEPPQNAVPCRPPGYQHTVLCSPNQRRYD